jgi:hypothetical protein
VTIVQPFRIAYAVAAVVAVLGGAPTPSYAETGTVRLKVGKAAFIVGVGRGSGTLEFRGKTYGLRVRGLSIGAVGLARADLVGTASNMQNAADIAGTYSALSVGVAAAAGPKSAYLQNSKGVILNLRGIQAGVDVSFAAAGVNVSLQ